MEPQIEKLFLSLMLHYPPYIRAFEEMFPNYSFSGDKEREIFTVFSRAVREYDDMQLTTSKLLNRIAREDLKNFASELLMMEWGNGEDRERFFQELIHSLKNQEREGYLKALRNQISQAEEAGNQDLVLKYMKVYQEALTHKAVN